MPCDAARFLKLATQASHPAFGTARIREAGALLGAVPVEQAANRVEPSPKENTLRLIIVKSALVVICVQNSAARSLKPAKRHPKSTELEAHLEH